MSEIKQIIICLHNHDKNELIKYSVKAGMEIKDQFIPDTPNYAGKYEHSVFKNDCEIWKNNGYQQEIIEVDNYDQLLNIELYANMECLPVSYLNDNINVPVLVIGPCNVDSINNYLK